jgi:hypothetical protein
MAGSTMGSTSTTRSTGRAYTSGLMARSTREDG